MHALTVITACPVQKRWPLCGGTIASMFYYLLSASLEGYVITIHDNYNRHNY